MTPITINQHSGSEKFDRRLPLYRVLAATVIAVAVVASCVQQILRQDGDPAVFVTAARSLLQAQDIYLIPSPHGRYYYYPPFFAFLNIPLVPLPTSLLFVGWCVVSVVLLGWSIAVFYGLMTGGRSDPLPAKTRWVVLFLASVLTSRFTLAHLRYGQSNILVLALLVLALTWLNQRKSIHAGLATGFSTAIKLTTLPLVIWFLARRNHKVLPGILLAGVIAVLLPASIVGLRRDLDYHREWLEAVVFSEPQGSGSWSGTGNLSLRAQADRFFSKADAFDYKGKLYRVTIIELPKRIVQLLTVFAMLAIALSIVLYANRFRDAPELISRWGGFAFVFSLMPLFSPVTEIPHLVVLIPSFIYVVHIWYCQITTDRIFRALVIVSVVLTSLTTKLFLGVFVSRLLTACGCFSIGMTLLSMAVFRAAICVSKDDSSLTPFR